MKKRHLAIPVLTFVIGLAIGAISTQPSGLQIEDRQSIAVVSYESNGQHQLEIYESTDNAVSCLISNNTAYESGNLAGAKCWKGTALTNRWKND